MPYENQEQNIVTVGSYINCCRAGQKKKKQPAKNANEQTERQPAKNANEQTERQPAKNANEQVEKQPEKNANKQTEKQPAKNAEPQQNKLAPPIETLKNKREELLKDIAAIEQIAITRVVEQNVCADDLPESIDDFEDMKFLSNDLISDKLFSGIYKYGFKYPSPIQAKSIHIVNSGVDLIAQAQSGTGKTGAFTIGALSRINPKQNFPQIIILSHSRPLACQTLKVVEKISIDMNINCCLCVGGTSNPIENAKTVAQAHILIGTPGRLCDLIGRKTFDGNKIKTLIIDEADELMKKDFRPQLIELVNYMGPTTQICVFSATYTKDSLKLTEKFLNNPYKITIEKEEISLEKIHQYKIDVQYDSNKPIVLEQLFNELFISQMIIFVNTTKTAINLRNTLMKHGIEPGLVHGKMSHDDRENILVDFRLARIKTLISTDVMCRGIDVDDLRIVINYDMALDPETYIHRIGRSGRFGAQGIAINFCTFDDFHRVRIMQRQYGMAIIDMPIISAVNDILTGMVDNGDKIPSTTLWEHED